MNATLQDAIDSGLAALAPSTAVPTGSLGYGVDIIVDTDVSPTLAEEDPTDAMSIARGMIRRADTPRGTLPNDGKDARDYGISLREYVNRGTTRRDLNALQSRLESEWSKDDRISRLSVTADVSFSGAVASVLVRCRFRPKNAAQTFELVLAVTSATIVVDSIAAVQA
jgi:hypothetical protein